MTSRVAVVTDSAASIPAVLAARWGIGVVALQIVVDGQSRPEGGPSDSDRVLAELEAGVEMTTSQPSVGEFAEAYTVAAAGGAESIVSVHISGELSGTTNSARAAAAESPVPVTVLDSRTLAMAAGFAALAAAAEARAGASHEQVVAAAEQCAASSACYFTVDTLEYLRRGGRVSGPLAVLGSALSIRPVLEIRDGKVELVDRVRTTVKARALVADLAEKRVVAMSRPGLAMMALGAQEYADEAATAIEGRNHNVAMLVRTPVSAVLAAHTGPGTLAAAVAEMPASFR